MKILIYLITALLLISFISAYTINQTIYLNLTVQDDSNNYITSQICIGAVYFWGNESFLFKDRPLTNIGNYHLMNFTPTANGNYVITAECSYNNETSSYYQDITVQNITPSGGAGGGTPYSPPSSIINNIPSSIYKKNIFTTTIYYKIDGQYADSYIHRVDIYNANGEKIDSVELTPVAKGEYQLEYDFSGFANGEYTLSVVMDEKTDSIKTNVSEYNAITGMFINTNGTPRTFNIIIAVVLGILFLILLILLMVKKLFVRKKHEPI